eukprot:TRINITY_DN42932_c0_g1_i1.p1 TRINITY_DN42932_c0_g1~~TRINITY_DN42932_c0_g1_i1.p1  ORF type:complete len:216 (-),score=24.37 TRINITY_DN42932_c0_g1_i1:205-816(-)
MLPSGDRTAGIAIDGFHKAVCAKEWKSRYHEDVLGKSLREDWPRHSVQIQNRVASRGGSSARHSAARADGTPRFDGTPRGADSWRYNVRPPSHHGAHVSNLSFDTTVATARPSFMPCTGQRSRSQASSIANSPQLARTGELAARNGASLQRPVPAWHQISTADMDRVRGHTRHGEMARNLPTNSADITTNQAFYPNVPLSARF